MKHTPGPWIAPHDQVNLVCTVRDWADQQIGALGTGFQVTISMRDGEARAHADARLIAAAPDMLVALKDIVKAIEIARNTRENDGPRMDLADVNDGILLEAIAQAEGTPIITSPTDDESK